MSKNLLDNNSYLAFYMFFLLFHRHPALLLYLFFFYKEKFPSSLAKITRCITQLLYKRFMLDDDFLTRYQSSSSSGARSRCIATRERTRDLHARICTRTTRRRR